MAIDDNTLYGLTGAQVKELPGKIEAVKGKAKVLTTDDYNWNRTTGTATDPNCVAVWRLPAGIYTGHTVDVTAYPSPGSSAIHPSLIVVAESYTGEQTPIIYKAFNGNWYIGNASDSTAAYQTLLTSGNITNNLTSTSTTSALSANQGKVLKDFIGDLTNLTTTDKTNLVAAINEAAAGGGGGSGPTVVQTTGTSTTDVMSQNAVTSMAFADPSTKNKVQIGTTGVAGVADNVGLGYGAAVTGGITRGAISLGAYSNATQTGQMDIGTTVTYDGYNSSNYRLLTGLYDPQNAHDAATKGYVDTAVAGAGASAFTTNEWNALWA